MKTFEKLYLSFYFLVRKDKYLSRSGRIRFLIETVLFFSSTSLLCVVFGLLNIKQDGIVNLALFMLASLAVTKLAGRLVFGKGKEHEYIRYAKKYDLSKRKVYSYVAVGILFVSFLLLFLSAIFMSYLWSIAPL